METIKVNMNPNPLDVQTIHASQNDGEAREWEFELHNNGELIDTSDVKEQLVFKAYKGGTEQLLPENGSTPTTSPFKGDIRYPQGLLTDQEFLYRESPTEEDGLAKITDIKGNTLVWNQLIQNGNFADTSNWSAESGATLSISNNIATVSSTTANNGIRQSFSKPLTANHKYLVKAEFNVPLECRCVVGTAGSQGVQIEKLVSTPNTWTEVSGIGTSLVATTAFYCFVRGTTYENVKVRNVMCFDITAMGLDISNPSDLTSLFPLSYYSYNQGSLLSFNGNGIKTVGKNLMPAQNLTKVGDNYRIGGSASYYHLPQGTYTLSSKGKKAYAYYQAENDSANNIIHDNSTLVGTFTLAEGNYRFWFYSPNSTVDDFYDIQLEFGSTATEYEPYTSSIADLPISQYFPTGMKDVPDYTNGGKIYDEWTPAKATTRIGAVDLGSLPLFYYAPPTSDKPIAQFYAILPNALSNVNTNVRCVLYTASASPVYGRNEDKTVCTFNGRVYICDSAYTDATAFKTAMSGVYLYYPLATPIETSFTTASLVTENAEIPLSNEDGVLIGKCTEQLSENPGFIDAKIKLSDSDGECYSNKIQLHVERSPQ